MNIIIKSYWKSWVKMRCTKAESTSTWTGFLLLFPHTNHVPVDNILFGIVFVCLFVCFMPFLFNLFSTSTAVRSITIKWPVLSANPFFPQQMDEQCLLLSLHPLPSASFLDGCSCRLLCSVTRINTTSSPARMNF